MSIEDQIEMLAKLKEAAESLESKIEIADSITGANETSRSVCESSNPNVLNLIEQNIKYSEIIRKQDEVVSRFFLKNFTF